MLRFGLCQLCLSHLFGTLPCYIVQLQSIMLLLNLFQLRLPVIGQFCPAQLRHGCLLLCSYGIQLPADGCAGIGDFSGIGCKRIRHQWQVRYTFFECILRLLQLPAVVGQLCSCLLVCCAQLLQFCLCRCYGAVGHTVPGMVVGRRVVYTAAHRARLSLFQICRQRCTQVQYLLPAQLLQCFFLRTYQLFLLLCLFFCLYDTVVQFDIVFDVIVLFEQCIALCLFVCNLCLQLCYCFRCRSFASQFGQLLCLLVQHCAVLLDIPFQLGNSAELCLYCLCRSFQRLRLYGLL